jgi:Arc/MetJ family transcription regulator
VNRPLRFDAAAGPNPAAGGDTADDRSGKRRYHAAMGRRVSFYLDDDLIESLNQHTQVSPLSRSEIVAIALRRLLREERRRAKVDVPATEMARRIAAGELPSRRVDGSRLHALPPPWEN